MKRKKWALGITLLLLLLFVSTEAFAQGVPTKEEQGKIEIVVVKGEKLKITPDMGYSYIDSNGRTMVPLRAIAEAMGLDVQWQANKQRIVIDGGTQGQVVFTMGSKNYTIAGKQKTMDSAPVSIQGRIHVPVRFVVESTGGLVDCQWKSGMYKNTLEVIIYFNRDAVTPTPPEWATKPGDYTTFRYTNAYLPENWAIITDLREKASKGEDVSKELAQFVDDTVLPHKPAQPPFIIPLENKRYDAGIGFEALLIAVELAEHGYNLDAYKQNSLNSFGTWMTHYNNHATAGQETINSKWKTRLAALCEKKDIGNISWVSIGWHQDGSYYQASLPEFKGNENLNRLEFFNEHYFDKVRDQAWFAEASGDFVYYDYLLPNADVAPYNDNGTMMFDLLNISDGLGWTNNEYRWWVKGFDRSKITLTRLGSTMILEAGSNKVTIDGKVYTMSKPMNLYRYTSGTKAVIDKEKGMPMVPQDFITEILDQEMTYNRQTGYWLVSKPENMGSSNLKEWNIGMSAVMAAINEKNPYLLGMVPRRNVPTSGTMTLDTETIAVHNLLADTWSCENGDDVKQQAEWLLSEGHREAFKQGYAPASAPQLTQQLSKKWGEKNILAWDMFRVAHLASWGYSAEYLTLEESMALTEKAAQQIRKNFSSWDEAYENYLDGYLWWSGNNAADYETRKQIYQELKAIQQYHGTLFNENLFKEEVIPYSR